jgi:hypothetical protein
MEQCSQRVEFQLPNDHTRVGFLLDGIQSSDAGLNAAIAQVRADGNVNGKRSNFESTASFLLPYDPVAKKRQLSSKRDHDSIISDTTGNIASTFGTKPGLGKSGVHLRYHTKDEYKNLSSEQKLELKEWRGKTVNKNMKKNKRDYDSKSPKKGGDKKLISAIQKAISNIKGKDKESDDLDNIIMSLQSTPSNNSNNENQMKTIKFAEKPTTTVSTSALKSIIRRAKNSNDQTE